MLNVVMLSVIMLSAVVPSSHVGDFKTSFFGEKNRTFLINPKVRMGEKSSKTS